MTEDQRAFLALRLFQTFSRERDPFRAEQRFNRLPDRRRDELDAEVSAVVTAYEQVRAGEAA